ncbi:MAG: cysteine peptidase family C39 domain-containing protein, partial [Candidatus Omnitrophica bacterium]|nr:cysteine peptidase family C39 domain-containing protein [Candidatus Omnitrophota bacterium]
MEFEADSILAEIALPEKADDAATRILNVTTGDGSTVGDISTLINDPPAYTADSLSYFVKDIDSSMLEGNEPIATKYAIDDTKNMTLEYIQKKDGSIEHYDADGKVRFVTNSKGELLVRRYYDSEGSVVDVRMWAERNLLNHEIISAEIEIMKRKIEDLQRLSVAMNAANAELDNQVEEIQAEIDSTRALIESFRYISYEAQVQSFFGAETVTVVVENPYYADMIAKLDLAERQFHDNAALQYFGLENMESVSRGRIEAATMAALTNLKRQRDVCMTQVLRKELTSVIYDYYLKILGRLPASEELNDLIERLAQKSDVMQYTYTIDLAELRSELEAKIETTIGVSQIGNIVEAVKLAIETYMPPEGAKEELIESLRLGGEEIVTLIEVDWAAIYNWLTYNQANTKHFGQSAFLALKGLIDDYYAANPDKLADPDETPEERYVRLAVRLILIDILTGSINPYTEGDLQISLFALSKAAQAEGLDLDAYKLEWDDLVERVADYNLSGGNEKVIVNVNSNHYVVVTSIDAENNVTYYEPNMGVSGESVTVSQDEFLNLWKGYALSTRAPPEPAKKISSFEAQKVKGSGIFLVISIILSIISFGLSFIDNQFCQILSKILAITAIVCAGIGILEDLHVIFESVATGLGFFEEMFTTSFSSFGDMLSFAFSPFIEQATLANLGTAVFNTIISIPVSITMTKGFEFMGLDPRFARIASSFITAGISMVSTGAVEFSIGGALQGLAIQSATELGAAFGVDPNISNIIGIAASTLIGAAVNGVVVDGKKLTGLAAIGHTLGTVILPNVAGELAYYGIQKLGELVGIDPRISQLAGIGIRSGLQIGLSGGSAADIWGSVSRGLLQGVTNIGLNYVTEELGLSPLLANIGFSAISGAINAGIQAATGGSQDVFGSLFQTYTDNALTFLGYGDPSNAWQQAAYISRILDFSDIVQERGLVEALNTYGAGFFNAVA